MPSDSRGALPESTVVHLRPPAGGGERRPRYVERHANPAALKASLERLLREEFDVIAGSHARPFCDDPKTALARLNAAV